MWRANSVAKSILGLLTVLVLRTPVAGQQSPPTATPPCPEPGDARLPVQATVGQSFTVALAANRTTGFQWQLVRPLEEDVVRFVSSEYVPNGAHRPGSGGKECWTFQAVKVGETTVALHYLRPFEKDTPPARTQSFPVTVLAASAQGSLPDSSTTGSKNFTNPFAYCAAVGTLDTPDNRYTGPPIPKAVARGLKQAFGAPQSAPLTPFMKNSFWRCMDGKVYACNVGANLPCQSKADTSRTPNAGMIDFCKENPNTDFIPAVATGRETIYAWQCTNGAPTISREVVEPDARGFIKNIWYEISPR